MSKFKSNRFSLSWVYLACIASAINAQAFVQPYATQSLVFKVGQSERPVIALFNTANGERDDDARNPSSLQRRNIIQQSAAALFLLPQFSLPVNADDEALAASQPSEPFVREPTPKEKFSYTVTPPPSFIPGNKPLKTHLDEINFSSPDVRGYTVGVTVDPVRISSIRQFGTPEEVAARVVTAEVNRDGVFQVTLAKDPVEDVDAGGCYDVEYISEGKRGIKHFATRIYVQDGFLYVLTVQVKESDFDIVKQKEVMDCVKSFKPL